jgi:hypothetical protein
MKLILALAALAIAATPAHAQVSGSFDVDVEISKRSGDGYVAQFRVRDAVSHEVVAEPSIPFEAVKPGAFTVGATPVNACSSDGQAGYCVDFFAGGGAEQTSASYEAFITQSGEMRLRKRHFARRGG